MKFILLILLIFYFSVASADTVGVDCPPDDNIGNLDQLTEVVKKSEYLIKRDQKLAENSKRIKELLAKNNIIGVELIVAGPMDERFSSRWGHAMLRLVDNDGDWRNDYVISFVLDQDEEDLGIAKSIFGGYPVMPETRTFGAFWEVYAQGEARPLKRVLIPSDKKMIDNLLLNFKERSEDTEKLGSYTFLSNNCAGVLSDLLGDSGFAHDGQTSVPTKMESWLQKSFMSPYPSITVTPPKNTLEKAAKKLGITYNQLEQGEGFPENSFEILTTKLSEKEQQVLYSNVVMLPDELTDKMANKLADSKMSIDHTYGFDPIPLSLYSNCSSSDCIKKNEDSADKIWSKKELDEVREIRRHRYFETFFEEDFASSMVSGDEEVSGIDHPWFDIDEWDRKYRSPKWIKNNKEVSQYMRALIFSDKERNSDIIKKECGKMPADMCLSAP